MKPKREEDLSRAELVAQLRSLEARLRGDAERQALLHELQVHQAELEAQQVHLIETQDALQESRDRYAALFDLSPVGYVTMDEDGIVDAVNVAALRLLNMQDRVRVVGSPFQMFVEPEYRQSFRNHLLRCRNTTERVDTELTLRPHANGHPVIVQLCSRRAVSPEASKAELPTSIIDLSALRNAEAERRAADDRRRAMIEEDRAIRLVNAAKDRFLAALSHELRTPLTPILLTLDALEGQADLTPALRETCRMIRRNAETEARLIDDLLDVSRIANDKLRCDLAPIDLHDVLRDVANLYAEEARSTEVALQLDLAAAGHHVLGDLIRLRQVYWNLVRNALRHTRPGGHIEIRSDNPMPGTVRVVVADTGGGIPAELLERIFEPFEQADRQGGVGLGLGLAISKGLVERHAGRIVATSQGPGKGAEFTVELPTVAAPAELATAAMPAAPTSGRGTTVLLIEDHPDTADAMCLALEGAGYDVIVSHSMGEALANAKMPFDIVVSDISLPDGSGLELMGALLVQRPVVGIALSGYGTEDDMEASRLAGFQRHLVKPVDLDKLLRTLAELTST